ncbi:hypothetical protein KQ51_00641 [Candidatus Izimaplasma bacterium HR1]|jgi:quercetin dioxygenase-like cupin family protein|uniref:cupin domain-containing protein n=1 Tax=Candidatus Izimoplasma sp. HR1 TaxID=1541959 RepID=UPI0004F8E980|nr:hypothetical protein KQ51_00641 [Candidatus Izimaplasma bacterium HR1]
MVVGNIKDLQGNVVNHPSAKDAAMKVLVSGKEGWDSHVMRVVEVEPGGYTPKHSHPWPHINYIIEGKGEILIEDTFYPVESGSYAFVPNDKLHQFRNTGESQFKFICIVPTEGHK